MTQDDNPNRASDRIIWRFDTARFSVMMLAEEEQDLDLSWDDTGEVRQGLEDGTYAAFRAHCVVKLDGRTIGEDYLGNCIYKDPNEFRNHIGRNKAGYGSYFSDMVREAIGEARKTLANTPTLRH